MCSPVSTCSLPWGVRFPGCPALLCVSAALSWLFSSLVHVGVQLVGLGECAVLLCPCLPPVHFPGGEVLSKVFHPCFVSEALSFPVAELPGLSPFTMLVYSWLAWVVYIPFSPCSLPWGGVFQGFHPCCVSETLSCAVIGLPDLSPCSRCWSQYTSMFWRCGLFCWPYTTSFFCWGQELRSLHGQLCSPVFHTNNGGLSSVLSCGEPGWFLRTQGVVRSSFFHIRPGRLDCLRLSAQPSGSGVVLGLDPTPGGVRPPLVPVGRTTVDLFVTKDNLRLPR